MSEPSRIAPGTVLMVAAQLLTASRGGYGVDPDLWVPLKVNRERDIAVEDCAQMAWALARAVDAYAPGQAEPVPLRIRRPLKPEPLDAVQ